LVPHGYFTIFVKFFPICKNFKLFKPIFEKYIAPLLSALHFAPAWIGSGGFVLLRKGLRPPDPLPPQSGWLRLGETNPPTLAEQP
jgi:hypothetical protein